MTKHSTIIFSTFLLFTYSIVAEDATPAASPQETVIISETGEFSTSAPTIKENDQTLILPNKSDLAFLKFMLFHFLTITSGGLAFLGLLGTAGLTSLTFLDIDSVRYQFRDQLGLGFNLGIILVALATWLVTKHVGIPLTAFMAKKLKESIVELVGENKNEAVVILTEEQKA